MSDVPVDPTQAVPVDGGPLYCRNCSTELEPGAQFCSDCGAATHAGGAEDTITAPVVHEPARRTTVVDEPAPYAEPMGVVRQADNWWGGPFMFMAAAILVVLVVVLAVALSHDGEPPATTIVPVTTLPPTTVVPAPVIVPPPVITPAPAQTQPPQTAPPQTQPPQTAPAQTQPPQTTATTAPPA